MKSKGLMKSASRMLHKTGFKLKKHSPEILIVAGVVGTVASAVMACRATTKLDTVLNKAKNSINDVHVALEKGEVNGETYTTEDSKKDLTIIYTQTGVELFKLYAPSIALGALSLTAIVTSNNILRKRNVALAAAYTAVDKGFKKYRGEVVDRFGKELDYELRNGIRAKEVEERIVDDNGNEHIEKKTVYTRNEIDHDEYTRIFEESNPFWEKSSEYNLTFLMQQQRAANKLLEEQGYLFLNDVYKMLGFKQTQAGQEIGWGYDPKDPTFNNYVDFGIHDQDDERKCAFVNGDERNIWLDFNVDGPVMHLLT